MIDFTPDPAAKFAAATTLGSFTGIGFNPPIITEGRGEGLSSFTVGGTLGFEVLEAVGHDGEIDGLVDEIDGITEGKFPFFDGLKVDGRGVGWKLVGLVQL